MSHPNVKKIPLPQPDASHDIPRWMALSHVRILSTKTTMTISGTGLAGPIYNSCIPLNFSCNNQSHYLSSIANP
jgi:hypothetical protein